MKNDKIKCENVISVDTIENKNNKGDENMIQVTKKQYKKLSKGEAYLKYKSAIEMANALGLRLEEAEKLFKESKEEALKAKVKAQEAEEEALKAKVKAQEAEVKAQESEVKAQEAEVRAQEAEVKAQESEVRAQEAEVRAVKAEARSEAGLDIVNEVTNELDNMKKGITNEWEKYDDYAAELTNKAGDITFHRKIIECYTERIAEAKHDIMLGVNVKVAKKAIRDSEAQIRYHEEQINGAQKTMKKFKGKKAFVSGNITEMNERHDELNNAWNIVKNAIKLE